MAACAFRRISYIKRRTVVIPSRLFATENYDNFKVQVMERALVHVPNLGWKDECLVLAAKELNLPPLAHQIVGNGIGDLVCYFLDKKRDYVKKAMESVATDNGSVNNNTVDIKLHSAIEAHLDYILPYRNTWAEAMAICVDPRHSLQMISVAFHTTDDLCQYAGVNGSHMDWYSQRGLMLVLYGTTELFSLTDSSDNFAETK